MDDATKCEFGDVLFDELEQIAVRRGGFASLRWLKDHDAQIENFRKQVGTLKSAQERSSDLNPATVITVAPSAIDYVVRAHAAVRSVSDLAEVARSRLKAASQVSDVRVAAERTAEEYRARGLTEEWDRLQGAGTTSPLPVLNHRTEAVPATMQYPRRSSQKIGTAELLNGENGASWRGSARP